MGDAEEVLWGCSCSNQCLGDPTGASRAKQTTSRPAGVIRQAEWLQQLPEQFCLVQGRGSASLLAESTLQETGVPAWRRWGGSRGPFPAMQCDGRTHSETCRKLPAEQTQAEGEGHSKPEHGQSPKPLLSKGPSWCRGDAASQLLPGWQPSPRAGIAAGRSSPCTTSRARGQPASPRLPQLQN